MTITVFLGIYANTDKQRGVHSKARTARKSIKTAWIGYRNKERMGTFNV